MKIVRVPLWKVVVLAIGNAVIMAIAIAMGTGKL
jgi:hypothetical protein